MIRTRGIKTFYVRERRHLLRRCCRTGCTLQSRLIVLIVIAAVCYIGVYMSLQRPGGQKRKVVNRHVTSYHRHVDTMAWAKPNVTTEMYVLSAYYDDRPTLDPRARPVVRIITIADKEQIEGRGQKKMMCVIWVGNSKWTPIRMTYSPTGSGGWYFREYIFVCDLGKLSSTIKPRFLSIIDESPDNVYPNVKSLYKIPIKYPHRPKKKLEFGACIGLTYGTIDPLRLVEWVELNRIWGVEEINIYGSIVNKTTQNVFMHYHNQNILIYNNVFRIFNETEEFMLQLMSAPTLNDCMYKNMYRYKHIVVIDLDEVIVPRGNLTSYTELLDAIDAAIKRKHRHRMYHFSNVYFFSELPQDNSMPSHLTTLRQVGRLRLPSLQGVSTKTIIDPLTCTNLHNHYCWKLTELGDAETESLHVPKDFALNQHYKRCHFDKVLNVYRSLKPCKEALKDYAIDTSVHRFKDVLVSRVQKELDKLGIRTLK
ncbi:uncharacterized protein LOC106160711 [Lingula anatina]|uniref:Glycosyltransferase family 92 protein n=1 Tax=Lingula anatina TaxID=7574 RepID=A0A1S3I3J6_LINAN|nr:uncharacterized protein LOC106160711 [Lingula anatina]|eukprot:XP_013392837.1 uncharacterized protein LOC106160711 [Lingula anatina]